MKSSSIWRFTTAEELNIPPNTLFTNEDAERAYKNAKECYTVADALKQTIEQQ